MLNCYKTVQVLLDGRKILQSEFWTVNRIKSKRLKQEALYGSYAPAEITADMQGTMPIEHTDSGSDAGTSRVCLVDCEETF